MKSMWSVEVDIAGDPDNESAVRSLRAEMNPKGVHVKVLELDGPGGGNPDVRLSSYSPTKLIDWLIDNDYDLTVHRLTRPDNARNRVSRVKH